MSRPVAPLVLLVVLAGDRATEEKRNVCRRRGLLVVAVVLIMEAVLGVLGLRLEAILCKLIIAGKRKVVVFDGLVVG